jgi:hypothetical protein
VQTRPALLATRNPPPALAAGPLNQALADIRELIAGFKDETKGDSARLRDELKSVKRDIAGLSFKVDKLEGKFDKLEGKVDTLVGTGDTAKRQLSALKGQVTGVKNQIANLNTDFDAGLTGLTTRNNESDELQRSASGGPIDPRNVSRVILCRWLTRAATTESAGPFFSFLTMASCRPSLPTHVRFCAPAVDSATFSEPAAFDILCILTTCASITALTDAEVAAYVQFYQLPPAQSIYGSRREISVHIGALPWE